MKRNECLNFLELPVNAKDNEIRDRLFEKKEYFSMLLNEAPNQLIKNIHQKNLNIISTIEIVFNYSNDVNTKTITQVKSNTSESTISNSSVEHIDKSVSDVKDVWAWLIRHTENMSPIMFELREGIYPIGRKNMGYENTIIIDDQFVSRVHGCIIVTFENNKPAFYIADDGRLNNGNQSLNGIYLNGNPNRLEVTKSIKLEDNDTVQIGETKLLLKLNKNLNIDAIFNEIQNTEYVKTVVINTLY